jgi:hypothetical protein
MYYWIQAGFELRGDVKRVATEQLDLACAQLGDAAPDPHEAVHECRRALRRLRALLALFHQALGTGYDELRAPYRSCTRALSGLRDAHALVETLRRVRRREGSDLTPELFESLATRLRLRRDRALETAAPDRAAMRRMLSHARRQLVLWIPRASIDVLRKGLVRRYKRARKAMHGVVRRRGMEATHALRRRSRELGLDYLLLQSVFPDLPKTGIRRAHKIAQLLGRERELLQLRRMVRRMRHRAADRDAIAAFARRLDASRDALHARALVLAAKVYDERPRRFQRHLAGLEAPKPAPATGALRPPGASPP